MDGTAADEHDMSADVIIVDADKSSEVIKNHTAAFKLFGDTARSLARQSPISPIKIKENSVFCENLIDYIRTLLVSWRQMNNYPAGKTDSQQGGTLDEFQSLFEAAYDAILNYIIVLEGSDYRDLFIELKKKLMAMSVMIEQQPVQTVKITDSKRKGESAEPSVILRCLLPRCFPENSLPEPHVVLRRVNDENRQERCSIVKYEQFSNSQVELKVNVKGAKVSKIAQMIMYILKMDFKIDDVELTIESLPIVFCTHTTQLPILSGYICWFNAFTATQVQDPFVIDDDLIKNECTYRPFHEVYCVLNAEFHSAVSVIARSVRSPGKSDTPDSSCQQFSEHSKICLREMLGVADDTEDVMRDALLNTKIGNDKKFYVWEWFFACYKTKCEFVNSLYEKGLLMGFVSKTEAERLLNEHSRELGPGKKVFLLRFSQNYLDNHHGLICPSVVHVDEPAHSKPILSSKFRQNEKFLGQILLKEMAVSADDLFVVLADGISRRLFDEAFSDFMRDDFWMNYTDFTA